MTRIGNVDHVLMLLQQQLQKLNSSERKSRTGQSNRAGNAQEKSSLRRVAALSGADNLSTENFERALIRALLVDELGEALTEDYRFDTIASEVYQIIRGDKKTHALLSEAAQQARNSAAG